ncbi:MAG: S8 family serine peptidase [Flavobacteriaceae bacterium]|nr:S8 family serine peptidase [Flavobacteriaceae bacterium]
MLKNYLANQTIQIQFIGITKLYAKRSLLLFFIFGISLMSYAQKKGREKRSKDIIPVIYCVKDLSNGLFQASFGYENPTNKEVSINEGDSKVKYNNGRKVANGLNKFKPGSNNKAFTKEFGANDYVEWTIISNVNTHTVIANANSAKCEPDIGIIEPVIGNGKSLSIIGQELTSLCENVAGDTPSDLIFQVKNGKVLVEIVPHDGQMQNLLTLLQTQFNVSSTDFLLDLPNYNDFSSVDLFMEKLDICRFIEFPNIINFVRPVYPAYNNSGGVITQGDAAQTSNVVRESFRIKNSEGIIVPVDGKGITVGVLSDSYDMALPGVSLAEIDVANGELPMDVQVLQDNAFKSTDEGRAMMQIIHDVAPGAFLQFHAATASPRQFEVGFNALALESDIIVDDITFITEPFFGTGRISQAIQSFVSTPGKFHFTSAGNLANKAHNGVFNSSVNVPITNFIDAISPAKAHIFGNNTDGSEDYLQKISVVPGTYLIALQWKENAASQQNQLGALDDLDIYIVDDFGRLLVGSNRVNVDGDPTEIIVFRATGTGEANILITSANGTTNVPFRYIAFRTSANDGNPDGLKIEEYFNNGAPTVSGHAMTPESITVGAVDYRNLDNPVAEVFSSYGGLLSDGTSLNIDIYAPDGGNTSSTTIGQDANCSTCDNDGILNFYGTSASAPHAAAATALLMSAIPSWYPDGSFTSAQALQTFQSTATSFTTPDGLGGLFVNTLAAFKSMASQTARVTKLIVEDGRTPSAEPFTVTIIGEFFPENEEDVSVLFDGQPLEDVTYTTAEDGTTVITATVPAFSGNPELIVVSKSITPGGVDGGDAEPVFFFDEGKIALSITANNAQFEFGQNIRPSYYRQDSSLPDYIAPFTVQGLPEGVTFESLIADGKLPLVILNNSAVDQKLATNGYPIVSDYVITPSFGTTDYDHDLYQINFISGFIDSDLGKLGYLTITKKELSITTEDTTITYGDAIDSPLLYSYDISGITDENLFYSLIQNSHSSDFKDGLPNKFRAVVSKFRAVVSGYDLLNLLNGGSWSASERTIQNKFRAVVSGMNIINLDNKHFTNFIDSRIEYESDPTINKFRAVVSKFRAVVSAQELFSGDVDLSIDNKFRAVVSKFKAVVSTEDPSNPYIGYSSVFTIVDAEDAPPENGSDPERAISQLYALNLITGLDVTPESENHIVYPGAFLNTMSANFNITYTPGNLTILPKELNVSTDNLSVPYGELLTVEKLNLITTFDGWVFEGDFEESVATVFPDGVPYYFTKVGGDGTELEINELKALGSYKISIRNPQNYILNHAFDTYFGTLTISPTTLTAETVHFEAGYGENFDAADLTTVFNDFVYDQSQEIVYPDGVPYYFVDTELNEYELGDKIPVGDYQINIRGTESYLIVYGISHSTLTITPALLTVKTTSLEIEYGDDVQKLIATNITGFATDETMLTVFPDGIQYLFVDGSGGEYGINTVKELGIYEVVVPLPTTSSNYEIAYAFDHGSLVITPRHVNVKTVNLNRNYGYSPIVADFSSEFINFAPDEATADVFGSSGISYYFEDATGKVFIFEDELEVGNYQIKIEETNNNYIFEFDSSVNMLSILPKTLMVTINDLVINQGETPLFTSRFDGFVFGDSETSVFPSGIPYYIVDDTGVERNFNDTGIFTIKVRDSKNYLIDSNNAKLYINPSNNTDKIRTYADCVAYDPSASDGLFYTVIYRYENDNDEAIFVLEGTDNNLSGKAKYEGQLPTVFFSGSGTFEIRFDGKRLVWSLTTNGSTHKSSVSSASTSESGKCDAKLGGIYEVFPNPVTSTVNYKLTIKQNSTEISDMQILNIYGTTVFNANFDSRNEIIEVDMSSYPPGMYYVRITNGSEVKVFSIIKE